MVVRFVTSIDTDSTLAGKLNSLAEICLWDYDESSGEISNPEIKKISVPFIIPVKFKKDLMRSVEKIEEAVFCYRSDIKNRFQKQIDDLDEKIKSKNKGTKAREKLEEKRRLLNSFISDIDKNIFLDGPFGYGRYKALHLVTPHLDNSFRRSLKDFFYLDQSIKSQVELSLNFPFCILDKSLSPAEKRIPLEALLKGKAVAKDYETHNWQPIRVREELEFEPENVLKKRYVELAYAFKVNFDERKLDWLDKDDYTRGIERLLDENKDERITVSSIINLKDDENYLITTLDCGKDEIFVDIPGKDEKIKVKIIKVNDQNDLISIDNELSEKMQALFVFGHNHLKFDYGKAEELTNNFRPGVDRKKVKHVSQAADNFIVQRNIPGRIDIDPAGFAQHYMPTYNNKLDTVFEHVLGIKSKKTMTHDELALNTAKAEQGDKKAGEDILYYAAQDAMKSYLLGEKLKQEHLLLSFVFGSLPSRFDTVAKKTLAEEYWINWHFKRKFSFPPMKPSFYRGFNDFDVVDYFLKELSKDCDLNPKKGLKECYLVAFFPFANVFRDLLERDPDIKAVFNRIEETRDKKEKARLSRSLESLAEYPLFKLFDDKAVKPEAHEKRFSAEFELGFSGQEVKRYKDRIKFNIDRISSFFKEFQPINSNNEFFILPAVAEKSLHYLTKDDLCVILGKGRFISGSRGRFAGNLDNMLFMQGIADFNSNKGERCRLEKEFYSLFFEKFLIKDDLKYILEYLDDKCKLLSKNKLPESDICFKRIARKNSEDYNFNANQGYIDKMREKGTRKGDELKYSLGIKEMQEKFFGLKINKKKDVKQKVLFDELDDSIHLDLNSGTISTLINYVFDFSHLSVGAKNLQRIFEGKGTENDIDALIEVYSFRYNH